MLPYPDIDPVALAVGPLKIHWYGLTYLAGLVRTVADIKKAKEADKTGIIFGFQNLSPIEDDLDRLATFHRLGVRVMQVTYMEANYAGQGCLERIDAGLTGFGIEAVEEMNRLGILIDLSHVGHRTTMDTIEASTKPVAFTHANPRSINKPGS